MQRQRPFQHWTTRTALNKLFSLFFFCLTRTRHCFYVIATASSQLMYNMCFLPVTYARDISDPGIPTLTCSSLQCALYILFYYMYTCFLIDFSKHVFRHFCFSCTSIFPPFPNDYKGKKRRNGKAEYNFKKRTADWQLGMTTSAKGKGTL